MQSLIQAEIALHTNVAYDFIVGQLIPALIEGLTFTTAASTTIVHSTTVTTGTSMTDASVTSVTTGTSMTDTSMTSDTGTSLTSATSTTFTLTYPVAIFKATDKWWSDDMTFTYRDQRFARQGIWDGNTDAGDWTVDGERGELTLKWDLWSATILTTSDNGYTFSSSKDLVLRIPDPPAWWLQLFSQCTFTLTVSRSYGADFTVEVQGELGDTFSISSCARPSTQCSSNGWGSGFNTIVNQDGQSVGNGNCCAEENEVVSVESSCSQKAAAIMMKSTTSPDKASMSATYAVVAALATSLLLVTCAIREHRRRRRGKDAMCGKRPCLGASCFDPCFGPGRSEEDVDLRDQAIAVELAEDGETLELVLPPIDLVPMISANTHLEGNIIDLDELSHDDDPSLEVDLGVVKVRPDHCLGTSGDDDYDEDGSAPTFVL
jgi:hypothetical protein